MRRIPAIIFAPLALVGCAGTTGIEGPPVRMPAGQCDASEAQKMVGQRATARLGEDLLAVTGATQLRWVPPRTAVTMDFRADRLTVSYDDDMVIERISCG